jgi:hypothetical protein
MGFACETIIRGVAVCLIGNARHEVVFALALIMRGDEGALVGEALLNGELHLAVNVARKLGNCRSVSDSEFSLPSKRLAHLSCNLAALLTAHGRSLLCGLGTRRCYMLMRRCNDTYYVWQSLAGYAHFRLASYQGRQRLV